MPFGGAVDSVLTNSGHHITSLASLNVKLWLNQNTLDLPVLISTEVGALERFGFGFGFGSGSGC